MIFLPAVFLIYWFVVNKSLKTQNVFLLLSSYFFYGCWDWRFVFLLAFSTFLDYFSGLKIHNTDTAIEKKVWLFTAVIVNISFLGFFKYFNFFSESFATLLHSFGMEAHATTLSVILPVGISFYTFHGLSYVFDIYNGKIEPTRNFVDYSLFVSFFPLLVAGPIERATHLLPQVEKPRVFNYTRVVDGLRQILWGFFKKVVIADNCAEYANSAFNNTADASPLTLIFGAIFFAFQIYGDFSGYSDIALGTARLFGFELLKNFSFPYFSRDIAEFWRRWHISLSSWFRDYLYIPLGGSKGSMWMKVRNTFIIFLVSGFWHGANWTFIVWGAINALFILPSIVLKTNRRNMETVAQGKLLPSFRELIAMGTTFSITVLAWIFFRAESLKHAFSYIAGIFSGSFTRSPQSGYRLILMLIVPFMIIEWLGRENNYALEKLGFRWSRIARWSFYASVIFIIGIYMQTEETAFIYFQF
ncbi:MBOAT family O-acyltransferase [Dyadobacter aurulentus]|uniref:MBOAT family O-acyltransferase n=1 Tax=Dyadobacter sp. UC 10 TaxID=2605428 RepID=UPI00286E4EDD|nr:MBOAT family O-acyltransferase [Dyadobacter sp. UC 10]